MTTATVLLFGMLFGLQHALEADHLAAVATLAARQGDARQIVRQGLFWGLGHTLALLLFGGTVLVVGIVLSERWAHGMEVAVGAMLIVLGADLLRRLGHARGHFDARGHVAAPAVGRPHPPAQRGDPPLHGPHAQPTEHRPLPLRALLVGMVHGLAGSAALVLLTLQRVGTPWLGLLYVLLFGLGSICGMAALSWGIALPMRLGARRLAGGRRWLDAGVALFSVALGWNVIAAHWGG